MGVSLANYGPLVAKDTDLFELDTSLTGINSSIKTNNNNVKGLIDKAFADHQLKGYVKSAELNQFMNRSSGMDYKKSIVIANELADNILTNRGNANIDVELVKEQIITKFMNFKKAYNDINYGVDMLKLEAHIDELKKANPNMDSNAVNAARTKYLTDDRNVTFLKTEDGQPIAPIFWMTWKQGTRIRDVIAKKKSMGMELIEIEQRFDKAFDPDNPDYKPFMYYSPSKLDDFLSLENMTDQSTDIAHYPAFFKSKKSANGESDDIVDVQELTQENQRKLQYTIEKLSRYSIATLQNKIIEGRYDNNQVSTDMDKAYKLINTRNNATIKSLGSESLNRQYKDSVMYAKQFASAYQALAAGTILTKSAVNNYLGGLVSIATTLGVSEGWRVASTYRQAARSNNEVERQTRALVDKHLALINPVSTKSEMILKDIEKDVDGKLDYMFNLVTNAMTKTGDFMMTKGLLGWIPGFKFLAFNRSEENISKMYNAILYDRISTYMKSRFEGDSSEPMFDAGGRGSLSKEFTDHFQEALNLFESDARRKGYQAIGQYDDNAKPLMFGAIKDADTLPKVIAGTFASSMFMFKMVEHNNMNLLNRLISVYTNGKNLNFKELPKIMMSKNTPSSMGIGIGLLMMSFYEWLADEYEFLPQVFNAYNAVPTKLPKDVALAAAGMFNIYSGDPVNPMFQNGQIDMLKFIGGPAMGGVTSEALMEWYDKNSPLAPYVKRWARAMSIEDSWGSMMMNAYMPSGNIKDMYKYQTQLKLSRGKTLGLTADNESGINIGAIPFLNVTPLGSGTGLAKLAQDLALITNSSINAMMMDGNDSRKALASATSNATQFVKDLFSVSVYIPDGAKEYNKYYNDFHEWKLNRLAWEYEYHNKPQTAQVYRTAQQQLNRIAKMPYIERPAYNQGDWKFKGQPMKAQMIANKGTSYPNR
jgi:hypothetical protein